MMLKKIAVIVTTAILLSGCTQLKAVERSVPQQSEVAASVEMDKAIIKQIEDKMKQEEEEKLKAEQEARLKQEQEANQKAEAEAKAKAEREANVLKAQKPAAKPAPKAAPVQQEPVKTNTVPNSLSTLSLRHPVEYKADIENEILVLVNQERAKAGVKPLAMNETLRSMARYKSNDMLQYDYFDHTSPNIGGLGSLAKKFGYSYTALGENIWMSKASSASYLRQNTTAAKIMEGWMNSPGHKANILNESFGRIGIGVTLSTDGLSHSTQEFSN